jgi:predicted nucleotidyltransferase
MIRREVMDKYLKLAKKIYQEKYSEAKFLILAGSIIRGEGTPTSDLDIVIIYDRLDCAFRESFTYEGIMVEVFAHDLSTLKYFMYSVDFNDRAPVMASMITEGIVVPEETTLSKELKKLAAEYLAEGPAEASADRINAMRYSVTNLIDDLKDSRNRHEQIATGCRLYQEVADLYFAVNRVWRGNAKSIVRAMTKHDAQFSNHYHQSFDLLFKDGNDARVVAISREVLDAAGGSFFDGYKLAAKPEWRHSE